MLLFKIQTIMRLLFTLLLVSSTWTCMAQNKQEQKLVFISIKEISEYYEVNEKNQIEKDTLFLAEAGFKIDPSVNHREIVGADKKVYVVFKFPNYTKQSKQKFPLTKDARTIKTEDNSSPAPTIVYLNHKRIDTIVTPATDSTQQKVSYDTVLVFNGKTLAIEKEKYERLKKKNRYKIWFKNLNLSYGTLSVPFKLRPSIDTGGAIVPAILTTETSIGPYIGIFSRIAREEEIYLGLTANVGASFIDVNTNNTFGSQPQNPNNFSVGVSWSVGAMFRVENFTVGYVLGMDHSYGSEADWYYNGKLWHSFSIGYNFTQPLKGDNNNN